MNTRYKFEIIFCALLCLLSIISSSRNVYAQGSCNQEASPCWNGTSCVSCTTWQQAGRDEAGLDISSFQFLPVEYADSNWVTCPNWDLDPDPAHWPASCDYADIGTVLALYNVDQVAGLMGISTGYFALANWIVNNTTNLTKPKPSALVVPLFRKGWNDYTMGCTSGDCSNNPSHTLDYYGNIAFVRRVGGPDATLIEAFCTDLPGGALGSPPIGSPPQNYPAVNFPYTGSPVGTVTAQNQICCSASDPGIPNTGTPDPYDFIPNPNFNCAKAQQYHLKHPRVACNTITKVPMPTIGSGAGGTVDACESCPGVCF